MDYQKTAELFRAEADQHEQSAQYLLAAASILRTTADYVDKQAGRGDLDLCKGAVEGAVKLLQDRTKAIQWSGVGR